MRQEVNVKWGVFAGLGRGTKRDERCAPGVVVFFDDRDKGYLLGDINLEGGACGCCMDVGEVVREILDLRNLIDNYVQGSEP